MSEPTRRERARAATDREIRQQARTLLINEGPEAVTLRAIARQLGITAPALYRYYSSREDLVHHVRMDICADLADDLTADLAGIPESDTVQQVLTICRGFRRWALAHPREFSMVFATPRGGPDDLSADPFGRIFLSVAGQVLIAKQISPPPDDTVPPAMRPDLEAFRADLLSTIAQTGVDVPGDILSIGTTYMILQFWVRLYGQVALEVFGHFPMLISNTENFFEVMLADLVADAGLNVD
ncbi:TetR/AcrR family transcriptional regulator [Kibdelosporangium phytohabitans]|uniref:TetR family transcriptional regulator n=1 Tax=Kibdelosporangium phytohabitans TaxID=860235 RepID=A0A0N9IFZ8_9PSEU|nr:TetR/AcrR family transcriptional regulator [Kibdelosporangium phytohabitans]ALG14408.1 TetR family transcriptional regulator [Kibdelosporangium phytohabitans]MBE1466553.1 AcrR family transcriptional regulator [Kibdelosporangium phytohabitans]